MCSQKSGHSTPPLSDILVRPGSSIEAAEEENSINCMFPRMHIDINMTAGSQYLAPDAHHSPESVQHMGSGTTLPDGSCSGGPPPTAAYQHHDMTPYSAVSRVSSFNQPAAVDATLLTPVPSAGSPPMQQRPSKLRTYQQDTAPGSQQPTPPNTSTMYNHYGYDINSSSQSSSPMNVQTQVSEAPYDINSNSYMHHSPQDDPLPPPQNNPYYGHYSASNVSVPNDTDHVHGLPPYQGFAPSGLGLDSPYGMMRHQSMHDSLNGSYPHRTLAPANHAPMAIAPLLHAQPNPSQYHRRESAGNMLIPRAPYQQQRRSPTVAKRSTQRKKAARSRSVTIKKETPHSPQSMQTSTSQDGSMGQGEGDLDDSEMMTLDDKTPADDRVLWNLRMKYRRVKGKGMWDNIIRDWDQILDEKARKEGVAKPTLQMKITRMVGRNGVWPEREKAALRRAYRIVEENRYFEVLKEFKKQCGTRGPCWDFKTQHIEAQLIKERLEELHVDDSRPNRRRRHHVPGRHQRQAGSRQSGPTPPQQPQPGAYYDMAYDAQRTQHYDMRRSPYDMMGDNMPIASALTPEENDQLMESIRFEVSPEPEEDDKMDVAYPEDHLERTALPGPTDVNAQRSEMVARQACGEMLKKSGYGGSS